MNHLINNRKERLARILATALLSIFVLASISGCGEDNSGKQTTQSTSSGGNTSASSSEEYYPQDDYNTLVPSKLSYADESIAKNFTVDGWTTSSPSSGTRDTEFSSVVGYWKAVMISDPEGVSEDGKFIDYFNVEIYGSPSNASVTVNWNTRIMEKTGEVQDLLGGRGGHDGKFSNGTISASRDRNSITLTDFWTDGNTQYALGRYTWPDKTEGYVGLIRP